MLKKENVRIILNAFKHNIKEENNGLVIGGEFVDYDLLVNLSTRKAIIPDSEIVLETENGFLKTNQELQTNIDSVYAIGDVNGKSRFAHISSAQGLYVINKLCGIDKKLEIEKYPLNMYTHPEIAQIGKTEQQLTEENIDIKISEFSLAANGKALAEGNNEGVIRILSEKKYGEVLGVQIIADNATDMISEAAAYMQLEATVYDVASTVHAHPTISEAFMEAGFESVDFAIHK
jgi:dihydrolipoamide dehydrogenase